MSEINGAAHPEQAEGVSTDSVVGAIASEGVSLCRPAEVAADAAAPPEPTPADSERSDRAATDSQESPAAEREGEAWVPWGGGECPVPDLTRLIVKLKAGLAVHAYAFEYKWKDENGDRIHAYRLANPKSRGPCTLPADHPHAAMERLYMSDDTLGCWINLNCEEFPRNGDWFKTQTPMWAADTFYHVGHVEPGEST